jgi:hypothetical protein
MQKKIPSTHQKNWICGEIIPFAGIRKVPSDSSHSSEFQLESEVRLLFIQGVEENPNSTLNLPPGTLSAGLGGTHRGELGDLWGRVA